MTAIYLGVIENGTRYRACCFNDDPADGTE